MDVGILGANGFLGRHLTESLNQSGHTVVSFVREGNYPSSIDLRQVKFDFHRIGEVFDSLADLDVVIHLVSSGTPASSAQKPYRLMFERNIKATRELLDFLSRAGRAKLVFASSGGAVYGNNHYRPITEAHKTSPISLYGEEKVAIEREIQIAAERTGLNYSILRLANPYGPYQFVKNGQGLVPMIIGCALEGRSVPVRGEGLDQRDYVFIEDVGEAFLAAINQDRSGIFNIGSGVGHSVLDLTAHLGTILSKEIEIDFYPHSDSDVRYSVLDSSLASRYLGWHSKTDLVTGLEKTVTWYLNQIP